MRTNPAWHEAQALQQVLVFEFVFLVAQRAQPAASAQAGAAAAAAAKTAQRATTTATLKATAAWARMMVGKARRRGVLSDQRDAPRGLRCTRARPLQPFCAR